MAKRVKPIPDGYQGATPYICVRNGVAAIDFYKEAFGATELMRLVGPDGKLGHGEIKIGEAIIMLADEFPEHGCQSPASLGGSPVMIHLYVKDVDAFCSQAIAAGAKVRRPVQDQFYGDRSGQLEDPFGHIWSIGTHKENLTPEEIQKRASTHQK